MDICSHERTGFPPLAEVEIAPEVAALGGFKILAQRAQAEASHLADRFPSVDNRQWNSHFSQLVEIEHYRGATPPRKVIELIEVVRRQGASSVYMRVAKNGEVIVQAAIPTTEGDKHVSLTQWAPEGVCTTLSEVKRAERVIAIYTWSLLAFAMVMLGFMVNSFISPKPDDTTPWLLATYVPLAAAMLSGRIRHKLINRSKQARTATT